MRKFERTLEILLGIILIFVVALYIYALTVGPRTGEPWRGDFSDYEMLNGGWTLTTESAGTLTNISLPYPRTENVNEKVILENTLPDTIQEGMLISLRSSMQNIQMYIGDELRINYNASDYKDGSSRSPSAYIMEKLHNDDSGKPVRIEITSQKHGAGICNEVVLGKGLNVWIPYIEANLYICIIAGLLIFLGVIAVVSYFFMRKRMQSRPILYLAETVLVAGMWLLSESKLRQLIFKSPSYANIYSFILIGTVAAYVALFFNEVQGHRYKKAYYAAISLISVQIVINLILNTFRVVEFHGTLIFSHIWSAIAMLIAIVTLIIDIRKKHIHQYFITAVGMVVMLITGIMELALFYINTVYELGAALGIGLIILLVFTYIQTIRNALLEQEHRRLESERKTKLTIETIASMIDARDKYTGGHSARVGTYARLLCEAVASRYGFTQEDSNRIAYIGTLHDIGKIGVPDDILNKADRLTEEEFEKMKLHTSIGADILKDMDSVEGLADGARHHHERFDGTGYPDGLAGEDIPIFARILCIADCFDAMTTDRVYRKHLPPAIVKSELRKCAGTQFDPELVPVFLDLIEQGKINCPE